MGFRRKNRCHRRHHNRKKGGRKAGQWAVGSGQFLVLEPRLAALVLHPIGTPALLLPSGNDASRKTHFLPQLIGHATSCQRQQTSSHCRRFFKDISIYEILLLASAFPTCLVVAIRRGRKPGVGLSNPLLSPRLPSHQSRSLSPHIAKTSPSSG